MCLFIQTSSPSVHSGAELFLHLVSPIIKCKVILISFDQESRLYKRPTSCQYRVLRAYGLFSYALDSLSGLLASQYLMIRAQTLPM